MSAKSCNTKFIITIMKYGTLLFNDLHIKNFTYNPTINLLKCVICMSEHLNDLKMAANRVHAVLYNREITK